MIRHQFLYLLAFLSIGFSSYAQSESYIDYMTPRDYTLAGIIVDGVVHLDHDLIIQKSELVRGEKISIPGEKLSNAVDNLWKQGFFREVEIIKEKTQGNNLFLRIKLKERERLSRYNFAGISK